MTLSVLSGDNTSPLKREMSSHVGKVSVIKQQIYRKVQDPAIDAILSKNIESIELLQDAYRSLAETIKSDSTNNSKDLTMLKDQNIKTLSELQEKVNHSHNQQVGIISDLQSKLHNSQLQIASLQEKLKQYSSNNELQIVKEELESIKKVSSNDSKGVQSLKQSVDNLKHHLDNNSVRQTLNKDTHIESISKRLDALESVLKFDSSGGFIRIGAIDSIPKQPPVSERAGVYKDAPLGLVISNASVVLDNIGFINKQEKHHKSLVVDNITGKLYVVYDE